MKKEIEEKRKRLEETRQYLKTKFIGIDQTIDQIIDKIEVWWCYPQFLTRPTVINLWGKTGIGKTDLIKELVFRLGLTEKFCEIQMAQRSSGRIGGYYDNEWGTDSSILGNLYDSGINPKHQSVLLLDEMQYFKSLRGNENDFETRQIHNYDDVWALLSDGKLINDRKRLQTIRKISSDFLQEMQRAQEKARKKKEAELAGLKVPEVKSNPFDEFFGVSRESDTRRLGNYQAKLLYHILNVDQDDISKISRNRFIFVKDKNDLMQTQMLISNSSDPAIANMGRMTPPEVLHFLSEKEKILTAKARESSNEYEDEDYYSKLLIFICGNIDQAFEPDKAYVEAHSYDPHNADHINAFTKTVKTKDIKESLHKLFRPHQVARFGDNYITCISPDNDSYRTLISRELMKVEEMCLSRNEIKVSINHDFLINEIMKQVDPALGIRPLLMSTIPSWVAKLIPKLLIKAYETDLKEIVLKKSDIKE